jgi:hypothetical protein
MNKSIRLSVVIAALTITSLVSPAMQSSEISLDRIAADYVKLVLALGQHDADYVDAYYGPPEWRKEAEAAKVSLKTIEERARTLIAAVRAAPAASAEELVRLRRAYLERQLEALMARVRMLSGTRMSFDEESKALYDAVAPTHPDEHFKAILAGLARVLPGEGGLLARYETYRKDFVIPAAKVDAVFRAAIEGCRSRTLKHVDLPPDETFSVEYVTGKSWSAYNWYQGSFRSLIQVNTDLPIYIDRAIDLACHEGYPGHHVYNALLEKHLVKDRGWVEFSVYPLFSPQSLIAEGTANYGIDVAFPGRSRVEFERDVLYPLAGLDPRKAEQYAMTQALVDRLGYAGNEAARRYLNGEIDAGKATAWLQEYALMSKERAAQRVRFMDQYRSYVINYNLGKDLVAVYIEKQTSGGGADRRWDEFEKLLSSPRLPSGLQ